MELNTFNEGLLEFLGQSPTPWHAVSNMAGMLEAAGFQCLREEEPWSLELGQGYYVVRNGSALVAFHTGRRPPAEAGWRMMGAHTDSPCLRVKPNPEIRRNGCLQLGVEVYGGALLNPWFDRDLSMAGRVTYEDDEGRRRDTLVDFRRPVAVIPSLAIHLDRDANSNRSINNQQHLPPVTLLTAEHPETDFDQLLAQQLRAEQPEINLRRILEHEICLYDTQTPAQVGLYGEFITAARLDNLLSCWLGVQSLLSADGSEPAIAVFNDHEEVGSMTAEGAQGPLLESVLQRWVSGEDRHRALSRSMMMSVDNAHAIHPNYPDRYDDAHGPIMNEGPVIKINRNQRYASSTRTSGLYRHLSDQLGVSCQTFVVRSDMGCGSTIGPLTAAGIGVSTLDVGVPQLAMHSIREMAGSRDAHSLYRVLRRYFELDSLWD